MREKQVEKYLSLRITEIGGQSVKFPPLFYAGFPDRLVFLPGGTLILVETKAPGKVPGKLQQKIHDRFRTMGFRVEILDSLLSVDAFILTL